MIRKIGKGGTGIVYLGYHLTLCKYVVIKKIKDNFVGNINARSEVDILKKLHHRYLPQVYDFLVIGTGVYTVMDYVDGHDLSWFIQNGYVFTEDQMTGMLKQLCEVLEYLHSQKPPVIHSDIKPGNIMIRSDGDVCLIDFNISLNGKEQQVLGYSPHFAAPEQLALAQAGRYGKRSRHLKVDERSDIYSLGGSFYYLMTGIFPQSVTKRPTVFRKKVRTCYSKDLLRIVQRAMELSRRKRYATAGKMRYDLEHIHTKKKRLVIVLLALSAVTAAAGGIVAGTYRMQQGRRRQFIAAVAEFNLQRQYGEPADVREQGMRILNDEKLRHQLDVHSEQKADLLAGIAESYYEEENYGGAARFLEEALECDIEQERRVKYICDYIISLIRSGQKAEAQRMLDLSRSIFTEDILTYLQAEFLLEEEETQAAYELFKELTGKSRDREIRMRSCILAAECLKDAGREQERMEVLAQAQTLISDRALYRKIGEAYVEIAQSCAEATTAKEALAEAEKCYALLAQGEDRTYLDRFNYAVVLEMQENYRDAWEVLCGLEEDFPQEYRTYREKAWVCYWTELLKDADKRDFQGVLYYGRLAQQRYTETDEADEKMEVLKALLRQLSR